MITGARWVAMPSGERALQLQSAGSWWTPGSIDFGAVEPDEQRSIADAGYEVPRPPSCDGCGGAGRVRVRSGPSGRRVRVACPRCSGTGVAPAPGGGLG